MAAGDGLSPAAFTQDMAKLAQCVLENQLKAPDEQGQHVQETFACKDILQIDLAQLYTEKLAHLFDGHELSFEGPTDESVRVKLQDVSEQSLGGLLLDTLYDLVAFHCQVKKESRLSSGPEESAGSLHKSSKGQTFKAMRTRTALLRSSTRPGEGPAADQQT